MKKTIRMRREHLDAWLHALRTSTIDGKPIKQASQEMRRGNAYCYLGVLQKVVGGQIQRENGIGGLVDLPAKTWLARHGVIFYGEDGGATIDPYLPDLLGRGAKANDSGVPFAQIADAIEACAEVY